MKYILMAVIPKKMTREPVLLSFGDKHITNLATTVAFALVLVYPAL